MTSPAVTLGQLMDVLVEEELCVRRLVDLARIQRNALVKTDYAAVLANVGAMDETTGQLDACSAQRATILAALGKPGAALREIEEFAAFHGVDGIASVGAELRRQAALLRDVQEQNAQLILSAARLRDRWLAMLTLHDEPAYGGGSEAGRYRLLSRTA